MEHMLTYKVHKAYNSIHVAHDKMISTFIKVSKTKNGSTPPPFYPLFLLLFF